MWIKLGMIKTINLRKNMAILKAEKLRKEAGNVKAVR